MCTESCLTCFSACPVEAGTPIDASGFIPISENDVAGIPSIALSIPDFEGQAILRIFSNSSQSQIGCYSGVVTNGSSFAEPAWVGSILGVFTFIAVLASFATAICGESVSEIRKHYAHSFSVLVVFAVWQHIYFSGALSMNWPSVLVAFWSNYAWAGGIINSGAMQSTINGFIGGNQGNISHVGAAETGVPNPYLGGGFDIRKIYRREESPEGPSFPGLDDTLVNESRKLFTKRQIFEKLMAKREVANSSRASPWFGHPVKPGIPLPGNYSGFAGTLAQTEIPSSNAFMTGLLWFLVLFIGIIVSVVAFKLFLEGASKLKMTKPDRLLYFRRHWLGYTMLAGLRTLFIGFFTLIFLSLFQISYLASTGPVAVACVVFLVMLLGLGGLVGYACFYRIRFGQYVSQPDRLNMEKRKLSKVIPWVLFQRNSESPRSEDKRYVGSIPWWKISSVSNEKSIHNNNEYTKRFGWLTARYRRTRWWFFVIWFVYEFTRACFLAGGIRSSMVQVVGLLVVETIAFIIFVCLRPFEGQRLNIIAVYALSFSKIATLALSIPLASRFNLPRILATVIGIVIIVIQGLLTIAVLICILLSASSSYMSLMRHREVFHPKRCNTLRQKYYAHMQFKEKDVPRSSLPRTTEPPDSKAKLNARLKMKMNRKSTATVAPPAVPEQPYFSVSNVRRVAKVEDEDEEFMREISGLSFSSAESSMAELYPAHGRHVKVASLGDVSAETPVGVGRRRSPSVGSKGSSWSSLPLGARVHRASWSAVDFGEWRGGGGWRVSGMGMGMGMGQMPEEREGEGERPKLGIVDSEERVVTVGGKEAEV